MISQGIMGVGAVAPVVRPPTIVPKRWDTEGMALLYAPSGPTDAKASSSASRGTRTWSNQSCARAQAASVTALDLGLVRSATRVLLMHCRVPCIGYCLISLRRVQDNGLILHCTTNLHTPRNQPERSSVFALARKLWYCDAKALEKGSDRTWPLSTPAHQTPTS